MSGQKQSSLLLFLAILVQKTTNQITSFLLSSANIKVFSQREGIRTVSISTKMGVSPPSLPKQWHQ